MKTTADKLAAWTATEEPSAKQLKRLEIIDATIECILDQGIEGTSFDAIGARLGMKSAHVVYYFKNKEELIISAVRYVASTAQRMMSSREGLDAREALDHYVAANFQWAKEYPAHARMMIFFYYQCLFKKDYRRMHSAMRAAGLERIHGLVRALPGLEHLSGHELLERSRNLQALITGSLVEYLTTEGGTSLGQQLNATRQGVGNIVGDGG